MGLRFHLVPGTGDVPPATVARHMGMTPTEFEQALRYGPPGGRSLLQRGFPPPDETTGNFCLEAIDRWRTIARYPHLYREQLTTTPTARDAKDVVMERLARGRGG